MDPIAAQLADLLRNVDGLEWSDAWHQDIVGWSRDILPYYRRIVPSLPEDAHCIEVGCYFGRSLIFLAEELVRCGKHRSEVHGFDPGQEDAGHQYPPAQVAPWGSANVMWNSFPQLVANLEKLDLDVVRLISIFREASPGAARFYDDDSLDLVFLDGDHREDSVRADIEAWLPKVKKGAGFLSGHDYGHPLYVGVKAAVDRVFGDRVAIYGTVWEVRP
jgi:hypothetical protein